MINNSIWGTMKWIAFVVPFFIFAQTATQAQSRWSLELHGGEVYNVPMPLSIFQDGYPELKLTARYNTEPFTLPVYWNIRLGRWQNGKLWEVEIIHHKLYLDNTTSEIRKFNISHGFNLIMLNRGFDKKLFRYRICRRNGFNSSRIKYSRESIWRFERRQGFGVLFIRISSESVNWQGFQNE